MKNKQANGGIDYRTATMRKVVGQKSMANGIILEQTDTLIVKSGLSIKTNGTTSTKIVKCYAKNG